MLKTLLVIYNILYLLKLETNKPINMKQLVDKAVNYDLIKITIDTLLTEYSKALIQFEKELEDYQNSEALNFMVELKKEHVDKYKGKIEILTYLKNK